jgi:hypothetical protein
MADKLDVKRGTLALMILRTLEVLGPLHGYGVARRIEETIESYQFVIHVWVNGDSVLQGHVREAREALGRLAPGR